MSITSAVLDSAGEVVDLTRAVGVDPKVQALYEDTYPQLASYCWTLVRDKALAEDLAQEAFVRLVGRWVSVRDPKPYVFHIATNLARETWRRSSHERRVIETYTAGEHRHVADDRAGVLAVRDAVSALPRKLREVVLLYYYADLPVDQVAKAVRRPPGTVKRHLSEARELLAGRLEDPHA